MTLIPTDALQFLKLGLLNSTGQCRSFDQSGDGYCRTEAIAAIFIQRKAMARRIYASIVHAKSNNDGYKEQGITCPLGERQAALLGEIYREANVDPNCVYYVECHGTGTKVGDPQEAHAITQIFCTNRFKLKIKLYEKCKTFKFTASFNRFSKVQHGPCGTRFWYNFSNKIKEICLYF